MADASTAAIVLRICDEALTREGPDRAAYLDHACAGEPELRRNVDAVLGRQADSRGFLETPPWKRAAPRLEKGQRLGAYEVTGAIGAGGMGSVYRARDTRLGRTVALKVIGGAGPIDAEARDRFISEAQAVASLNDPHICQLFDVGRVGDVDFLVMEFIEGETLADRLVRGPLALTTAVEYGAQLAAALGRAHRLGIVHRDVKPGNVMVSKDGVKLLDFGLADPVRDGVVTGRADQSAVLESPPIGTIPYMAPEQANGLKSDPRADIYALGCVLFEMLTGRHVFDGNASIGTVSSERKAPPLSAFAPSMPPALERLVAKCLAFDPDARWQSAADVADELRWILGESAKTPAATSSSAWYVRVLIPALIAVGGLVIAAISARTLWLARHIQPPKPAYTMLEVSPAEELGAGGFSRFCPTPGGSRTALAWAPDGQMLTFVGRRADVQQLYVRRLDRAESQVLGGTQGARGPAVSVDGRWVAFWADGKIKKTPISGGPVVDIASGIVDAPWGLVWASDGRLFAGAQSGAIREIGVDGRIRPVTTLDRPGASHILPSLLPGDRVLLFTERTRRWTWGDETVVAQTLANGARKILLRDAADARYLPSGHLVFLRRGVLYAVPFDAERVEKYGTEEPVLDRVSQALTGFNTRDITGAGQFAVAPTGTLAWLPAVEAVRPEVRLARIDRAGRVTAVPAPPGDYARMVRLSPTSRRLLTMVETTTDRGVYVCDPERGVSSPVATGGEALWPIWTPDGQRVAFTWLHHGREALVWQSADGTGTPEDLVQGVTMPSSWTPDGRELVALRGREIVRITMRGGRASQEPLFGLSENEAVSYPALSADGRWLAYASNRSGRFEVYVRAYSGDGRVEQVSLHGGIEPAWNPTGHELFFVTPADPSGKAALMSVDFEPGAPLRVGQPLFSVDTNEFSFGCSPLRCYDVDSDGRAFLAMQIRPAPAPAPVTRIRLIENWFSDLQVRLPVRR